MRDPFRHAIYVQAARRACNRMCVRLSVLQKKGRGRVYSDIRTVVAYILREVYAASWHEIAAVLEIDHTSAIAAVRRCDSQLLIVRQLVQSESERLVARREAA